MDIIRKESTVRRPETKRAKERFAGQKGTPAICSSGKLTGPPQSRQPPCVGSLPDKREAFCSLPPAREEPIKVAIVDDDGRARWFVRRILEQSGEFSCAGCYASGEAAIREVPKISPKVVLMEVRMPGISGIECTRRLKAMLPGLIVVLVSRLLDSQTMSKALQAGGDGYLTKP